MRTRALLAGLILALSASPVAATDGIASWWHGKVAAVPSCTWPWTDCPPVQVQSLDTGMVIVVTPAMWCQCYVGTSDERLIDLTTSQLAALGLDPAQGLYRVRVTPFDPASAGGGLGNGAGGGPAVIPPAPLPDTAMEAPR